MESLQIEAYNNNEKINQIKHLLIYLTSRKNIKLNNNYGYKNYISNEDKNMIEDEEEEEINTSSKKNKNIGLFKIKKGDLNPEEEEMINTMINIF